MFFNMANEWKDIAQDEPVFEFAVNSLDTAYSTQVNQVRLLSNHDGAPRLFYSDIETAVCADGECKLANIKVYWNLLGHYTGFGISPEMPLTKYEHDHFETEDYAKLHQLLLDDNSILKRRKMADLIDKIPVSPLDINSKDIDGISGATKKEIKESVVKGGLYSCYTLWHIVHGEVRDKMYEYFESICSENLVVYLLDTPYSDYQMYALKQLDKRGFEEHSNQIVSIFKTADASTRAYILKKISNGILSDQKISSQLYETFPKTDINTRTLLIKNLENAHSSAVEILSAYTHFMTKNHLKLYLEYLEETSASNKKEIRFNLKKAGNAKEYAYAYLIKEFLESNN
ncbi:MAG: hypothetical protein ABJG41_00590 [Cyclobacteriaceae bacterium]